MQFHAFDSFEGLPEPTSDTSVEIWKRGALTTSEQTFMDHVKTHGIYVDSVKTIKGFYSESLTPALRKQYVDSGRKIALVNIDCDLYELAVPVFDFIDPLLQDGAVIYVDDLFAGYKGHPHKGVAKAFLEWQKRTRWKLVRHLDIGWWGRSYIVYLDKERRRRRHLIESFRSFPRKRESRGGVQEAGSPPSRGRAELRAELVGFCIGE